MIPKHLDRFRSTAALTIAVLATAGPPAVAAPTASAPASRPADRDAAGVKRSLADSARNAGLEAGGGRPEVARRELAAALEKAAGELPPDSDAADVLRRSIAAAANEPDDRAALDRLQGGAVAAATAIDFKPLVEAPMPEGFPGPGPVGQVVVKSYPAYRLARTPMTPAPDGNRADDGTSFFALFRHIQANEIKMTAPVEMTYAAAARGENGRAADGRAATGADTAATDRTGPRVAPMSMAFLYRSPSQGKPGPQGAVEVADVGPMTVASVGLRGPYDDARVAEAVTKIDAWLKERGEYERAGDVRLMGYNSPMIVPWLRFSEVQVPVRKWAR